MIQLFIEPSAIQPVRIATVSEVSRIGQATVKLRLETLKPKNRYDLVMMALHGAEFHFAAISLEYSRRLMRIANGLRQPETVDAAHGCINGGWQVAQVTG